MNLRERARLAYLDRIEADEWELHDLSEQALRAVIGDDHVIHSVALRPYDAPPMAEFTAEGLTFRVVVNTVEHSIADGDLDRGFTWPDTETEVYVHRPPNEHLVQSLADLGEVLCDDPLDEAEATMQAEVEAAARARRQQSFGLVRGPVASRPNRRTPGSAETPRFEGP